MFPNSNLTIDCIYKNLLEQLIKENRIKDVSNALLSMQENHDKVLFVYKLLKEHKQIPLIIKEEKSEYASTYYRNLGNKHYQKGDIYKAWQFYNLALAYAPLLSPCYCLAVANRSAVFASMEQYKACLKDIEYVFAMRYPTSIRDKLLRRKRICEEALLAEKADAKDAENVNGRINDIFAFKGTRHEKYVAASSKLSVNYTPELGRHVVANEDIEVGEIIVQEDPYTKLLLKSQVLISCAYCFSRNLNLYPCPYCCVTMYCSRPCVGAAWDEYHNIECAFIASLFQSEFTKLELLAFRTTIKARTDHANWDEVLNTVSAADKCSNVEYLGCKIQNEKLIYSSKNYVSVHTLSTNIEKRDISDIFQKAVSAAILLHYMAVKEVFQVGDEVLKERIKKCTASTLLRHLMTAPTNMHGISTNVQNEDENYTEEYDIGCGAYPFLSLINHSCSPNVVRCTKLGTAQINLIALRPIKKGMQIFDNYGYNELLRDEEQMTSQVIAEGERSEACARAALDTRRNPDRNAHHAVHQKRDRQLILKNQYKFSCVCEACVNDWPMFDLLNEVYSNLPTAIAGKKSAILSEKVIEALQKGDKKRALQVYKPLCELATALEPYIPCREAAECQEAIKQCLILLAGALPKGFIRIIDWDIPAPKSKEVGTSRFYAGCGAFGLI